MNHWSEQLCKVQVSTSVCMTWQWHGFEYASAGMWGKVSTRWKPSQSHYSNYIVQRENNSIHRQYFNSSVFPFNNLSNLTRIEVTLLPNKRYRWQFSADTNVSLYFSAAIDNFCSGIKLKCDEIQLNWFPIVNFVNNWTLKTRYFRCKTVKPLAQNVQVHQRFWQYPYVSVLTGDVWRLVNSKVMLQLQ